MIKQTLFALAALPLTALAFSGDVRAASMDVHVTDNLFIAFGLPGSGPGYSHVWSVSGRLVLTSVEGDTARGMCVPQGGARGGRLYLTVTYPNGHTQTVNEYVFCPPPDLK